MMAVACLLSGALPLFAANIIHEFYVPMPEAQIRTAFVTSGIVGQTVESVISIVVTGDGAGGWSASVREPAFSKFQPCFP